MTMGRHSRSTYTARHALSTSEGAANYVGRVGALALALGIGVAVAGGGGVAHADGTTDNGTAGGGEAQSSPSSSTSEATAGDPAAVDSPADESPGAKPRKPGSSSGSTTKHSLPASIASVPRRAVALVVDGATGASGPPASPMRVRPKPQSSPAGSADEDDTVPAARSGDRPLGATPDPQSVSDVVTPAPSAPVQEAPIATTIAGSPVALRSTSSTHTGDTPVAPTSLVLGALQLIRRDIEDTSLVRSAAAVTTAQPNAAAPVATVGVPSPADVAHTIYGDVGTWLLQPNGQIANYGGVPHDGKTVLEPINVIILDPTSTSAAQSAARLDAAMIRAGFPAQPIHSTGFLATINGLTYGQQPTGFLQAFSDNFFLFPNDHGRMFGPAPAADGTGYVWTGGFSTEQLNPANPFTHQYVSSDIARAELARRLVASGAATVIGVVPLGNAYDDGTFTTGDHDGYAVVLQLAPAVVALLPTGGFLGAACGHVDDLPGPVARQLATGVCVIAASVSNALGLRSVI
jgi:hypothetical protein